MSIRSNHEATAETVSSLDAENPTLKGYVLETSRNLYEIQKYLDEIESLLAQAGLYEDRAEKINEPTLPQDPSLLPLSKTVTKEAARIMLRVSYLNKILTEHLA